jgi:hypothetical protein
MRRQFYGGPPLSDDYALRNTAYAREIVLPARVPFLGNEEGRMERLFVAREQQEEIRFSWWKDGRIMQRPLDLPETDLLDLLCRGFGTVLSVSFLTVLRERIDRYLMDHHRQIVSKR